MKLLARDPPHFFAAFVAGCTGYMFVMAATAYDGIPSLMCQPFVAGTLTSLVIVTQIIVGLPLLFWDPATEWWERHVRISQLMVWVSPIMMVASFLPGICNYGGHPETGAPFAIPNPFLLIPGWLGLIFGVLHYPRVNE